MHNTVRFGVFLAIASVVTSARADPADDGAIRLDVHVGQTVVVDVGYAMGIQCDDVTIIAPEIRAHDPKSNWIYVSGVRPGTTLCRAGSNPAWGPSYLFRVTVSP